MSAAAPSLVGSRASVPGLGAAAGRVDRRRRSKDLFVALSREHRRYDHLCRNLLARRRRRHELERLAVDLLAHEALEQILLYPLVAHRLRGGSVPQTERQAEEWLLELAVQDLLALPASGDAMTAALAALHRQLGAHADREELEIFPFLRHLVDREHLDRAGALYGVVHGHLSELPITSVIDLDRLAHPSTRPLRRMRELASELLDLPRTAAKSGTGLGSGATGCCPTVRDQGGGAVGPE